MVSVSPGILILSRRPNSGSSVTLRIRKLSLVHSWNSRSLWYQDKNGQEPVESQQVAAGGTNPCRDCDAKRSEGEDPTVVGGRLD
jgi:hypothetical protein